jgi:multidrug efflux system membrane fusion protein
MIALWNSRDIETGPSNPASRPGVVCVVALFGGVAVGASLWAFDQSRGSDDKPGAAVTVPVQTAKPSAENVPVYLAGLGTVQAFNTITVKTRVDGQLQTVAFREGQRVKKGDLLAVIDPRPFQAAVDEASAKIQQDEADLANAQYLLAKDQRLGKQGITTEEVTETQQSQVNQLIAQLAQDKAAKASADVSLSFTQIRSPIDGRTGIRLIDEGNQVQTTDTNGIVIITQTQPISVISTLREDDLGAIRSALQKGVVPVTALSSDLSTKLGDGTLSVVDNIIDQSSGTIRIKSEFENEADSLWPGQFVTLKVRGSTLSNALTVPSAALQRGADGFFVYVVGPDASVSVRKVTPGPIEQDRAVITSGLSVSDVVVTEGQYRLQDGTPVAATAAPSSSVAPAKAN